MKKSLKFLVKMAIVTIIAFGCYKSYDFYKHNKTQEKQTRAPQTDSSQKAFVILICAYNNAKYCEKNLFSAITQRYKNFRIVYIDDASTDGSFAMVSRMASRSDLTDRISLIKNSENKGALASLYNAVHTCKDHEIIVPVDGNDFLAHENVLLKLNKAYAKPATWMTYGNFLDYPSYRQSPMKCRPISKNIVFNNAFRSHEIHDMYLKTFYAALFKQIKKEDLLYKDQFLSSSDTLAYFLPLLELSGKHAIFINDILYLHTTKSSHHPLSTEYISYIKGLPKYKRLKMLQLDEDTDIIK